MNNKIKGDLYEVQIKNHIISSLNKKAYLWPETPENILISCGIIGSHNENRLNRKKNKENPLQDTGIDIIQVDDETNFSIVQCKNGYKNGLTMMDLAGFNAWLVTLEKIKGFVYYTNKLSHAIKSLPITKRITYVKHEFIENKKVNDVITDNYIPYGYQTDARKLVDEHYKTENRGILSMPCGTGKTFTSFMISKTYKQIVIISPLRQFAKQNLDKYISYGFKNKTLLIDSDGERDIKNIKKFIKTNNSFLISSTFCSVDCIWKCLDFMKNPLIIIDEFHNLSKTNVTNDEDYFYKILNSKNRILFMSATPRVYEMEDDDDYNLNIFGKMVYNMTFSKAIESKFITDYRIWLPSIHENNEKLDKELSIYKIDKTIEAKCKFLFSCLLNNGSQKCIIYCENIEEITNMTEAINKLDKKYFFTGCETSKITSENTSSERTTVIDNFTQSNKIQLLFSVRILDECIDIPSCDSIYITYSSNSKIRTIQRLSRCIRIDKNNSFKIGNIYIWCDEYGKILQTLSGIKEYDMFFKDKVKINEVNFHNNKKNNKEGLNNDIKLIKKYAMDIKEFKQTSWDDKFDLLKKYIDENNKAPSSANPNVDIRRMASWLSYQQTNYKNKIKSMEANDHYEKWTILLNYPKYKKYLISDEENWMLNFNKAKEYIDANNKKPINSKNDSETSKLAIWISVQMTKYKKKKGLMKIEKIYDTWIEFINNDKYKLCFTTDDDIWLQNLELVKKYIEKNNKRPLEINKNPDIKKIAIWVKTQMANYKNKTGILIHQKLYDLWKNFIQSNAKLFESDETKWINNLEKVKNYIDKNKKKLFGNKELYVLNQWIGTQQRNYKNKKHSMKNQQLYDMWTEFMEKYSKYIFGKGKEEETWMQNLEKTKEFIDKNNKLPYSHEKKNMSRINIYNWVRRQKTNYKTKMQIMQNEEIYNIWTDFAMQYEKYL